MHGNLVEYKHFRTAVQPDEALENYWFRRIFTLFDLCMLDT